jgi:predicted nucleic acid-binding protein
MPSSGVEPFAPRVALDTSAYSHLRRGESRVIEALAQAEVVYIPVTVLGELEGGFRAGGRYKENRRSLAELLAEPFVETIETTMEVAQRYGELFAALRRNGTPIPVNDIWIAAAVMTVGAQLVSFDADFTRIAGLKHAWLE